MLIGLGLELVLGLATLLVVPFGRPDQWLPLQGRAFYLLHAVIGGLLVLGSLAILVETSGAGRIERLGSRLGLGGLVLGAGGGMLVAFHPWRLAGMALMLAGTFGAWFGYLVPLLDPNPEEGEPGRLGDADAG
jgi:hypothetical protein